VRSLVPWSGDPYDPHLCDKSSFLQRQKREGLLLASMASIVAMRVEYDLPWGVMLRSLVPGGSCKKVQVITGELRATYADRKGKRVAEMGTYGTLVRPSYKV
jgi:hypothetical protein